MSSESRASSGTHSQSAQNHHGGRGKIVACDSRRYASRLTDSPCACLLWPFCAACHAHRTTPNNMAGSTRRRRRPRTSGHRSQGLQRQADRERRRHLPPHQRRQGRGQPRGQDRPRRQRHDRRHPDRQPRASCRSSRTGFATYARGVPRSADASKEITLKHGPRPRRRSPYEDNDGKPRRRKPRCAGARPADDSAPSAAPTPPQTRSRPRSESSSKPHDDPARSAGKRALVTGGAQRIGRAIALALADAGANVAITYRGSDAEAEAHRPRSRRA